MGAVVVASTRLNHHHVSGEGLAIFTAEANADSPGLLGGAAPPVDAGAAVLGAVSLHAGTARIVEVDSGAGFPGSVTLLPFFKVRRCRLVARANVTDSSLFAKLTLWVIVGDSCGNACPTGPGTLRPVCRLDKALGSPSRESFEASSE